MIAGFIAFTLFVGNNICGGTQRKWLFDVRFRVLITDFHLHTDDMPRSISSSEVQLFEVYAVLPFFTFANMRDAMGIRV